MNHHYITLVLAGGAAHFFTGWVLNNDMLLGQFLKKDKPKNQPLSKDMRINMAAQALASLALATATCVAICVFEKYQSPVIATDAMSKLFNRFFSQGHATKSYMNAFHTVLFIWAGFIVPSSSCEVIWCGHSWKAWLLEIGMDLAGLIAIAATVVYLG